jgi:hypothetical protein
MHTAPGVCPQIRSPSVRLSPLATTSLSIRTKTGEPGVCPRIRSYSRSRMNPARCSIARAGIVTSTEDRLNNLKGGGPHCWKPPIPVELLMPQSRVVAHSFCGLPVAFGMPATLPCRGTHSARNSPLRCLSNSSPSSTYSAQILSVNACGFLTVALIPG